MYNIISSNEIIVITQNLTRELECTVDLFDGMI